MLISTIIDEFDADIMKSIDVPIFSWIRSMSLFELDDSSDAFGEVGDKVRRSKTFCYYY